MANEKLLTEQEVEEILELYRRGNDLAPSAFPHAKNGFRPVLRHGDPGFGVDWATLEYMRSQIKDKGHELPIGEERLQEIQDKIDQLRLEFKGRSVLSDKTRNRLMEHVEEVIKQGEIAEIFYNELQKNGFDGDKAKEATRSLYERAWPALETGYSIQDLRRGERSGESDLNGPEGKVFDLRPKRRSSAPIQSAPEHRKVNSDHSRAADGNAVVRNGNPFDLERPDLKQQARLVEENPLRAKQLIRAAGRDPKLFGFA